MARALILSGVLTAVIASFPAAKQEADQPGRWLDVYREPAARILGEAMTNSSFAWERLAALTDTAGHRLSGSPQLERAIRWVVDEMKRDGLENVRAEPVAVPTWEAMGFGFVELGGVTWHPQPGNPSPRMFRAPAHEALVIHLGQGVVFGLPAGAFQLLAGQGDEVVDVADVAVLQQRIAEHGGQGGRDGHGQPPVAAVAFEAVEDVQERNVRFGDGLVEPVFFEEIVVLRVTDEGQVGVERQTEVTDRHSKKSSKTQV